MLGLRPDASRHDVKKAYRALAKRLHPDRGGEPHSFAALQRAHEVAMASPGRERPTHRFLEASTMVGESGVTDLTSYRRRRAQRSFAEELALALGH